MKFKTKNKQKKTPHEILEGKALQNHCILYLGSLPISCYNNLYSFLYIKHLSLYCLTD